MVQNQPSPMARFTDEEELPPRDAAPKLVRQVSNQLDAHDWCEYLNFLGPVLGTVSDRGDVLLPHLPRQFHDLPRLKGFSCFLSSLGLGTFIALLSTILATFSAGELSISREDHNMGGAFPLPPVAVRNNSNGLSNLDNSFRAEVYECTILDGQYGTKHCTDISHRLHTCFIPLVGIDSDTENEQQFMCLNDPEDPAILSGEANATIMIEGWFGSPVYRYVDFKLVYEGNSSKENIAELREEGKTWGTSLAVFDHGVDTYNAQWRSWYYNFGPYGRQSIECFFEHNNARTIPSHGFESLFGSELVERETYTNFADSYTRFAGVTQGDDDSPVYLAFFLRSNLRQIATTIRPPTVLSVLEDAGGLWSAVIGVLLALLYAGAFAIHNLVAVRCIEDLRGTSAEFKSDEKLLFKEFLEALYEAGALNKDAEYGLLFHRLRIKGTDMKREARRRERKRRIEESIKRDASVAGVSSHRLSIEAIQADWLKQRNNSVEEREEEQEELELWLDSMVKRRELRREVGEQVAPTPTQARDRMRRKSTANGFFDGGAAGRVDIRVDTDGDSIGMVLGSISNAKADKKRASMGITPKHEQALSKHSSSKRL